MLRNFIECVARCFLYVSLAVAMFSYDMNVLLDALVCASVCVSCFFLGASLYHLLVILLVRRSASHCTPRTSPVAHALTYPYIAMTSPHIFQIKYQNKMNSQRLTALLAPFVAHALTSPLVCKEAQNLNRSFRYPDPNQNFWPNIFQIKY